jgi:hypothetical protein
LLVIENKGSFKGSCILIYHSLPEDEVGYISFIPNLSTPLKIMRGFNVGLKLLLNQWYITIDIEIIIIIPSIIPSLFLFRS